MNKPPSPLSTGASERAAEAGARALHYVQNEIRQLSSIALTPEGKHALLCFTLMLRHVWRKEFRGGEFVFLDASQSDQNGEPSSGVDR